MEMQGTTLRKIVKTLIFLQSISTLSLLIKIDYKTEKKSVLTETSLVPKLWTDK